MTKTRSLLIVSAITLAGIASDASAWDMQHQGPQLTGIALQALEDSEPIVTSVTLPSVEAVPTPTSTDPAREPEVTPGPGGGGGGDSGPATGE